ncbi:MAG: hypothetical protein JSU94_06105 [Phycisphaerales bacterium]|nr:MAG: hypothetical protein JSU94_06105 [Phycisphaerales bacterium]
MNNSNGEQSQVTSCKVSFPKEQLLKTSEWQVAPHLGLVERPKGGSFLFNQVFFTPVRTSGSPEKVASLINQISRDGTSHLPTETLAFLANYNILVVKNNKGGPASEWSSQDWRQILGRERFVVRLSPRISSRDKVLRSLSSVFDHVRAECPEPALPPISLKFMADTFDSEEFFEHLVQVVRLALGRVDEREDLSLYLECPVDFLERHVSRILGYSRPSIRVNCVVLPALSENTLSAFNQLVENGFRPHLIFLVSEPNAGPIFDTIQMLAATLGPDAFTFSLLPFLPTSPSKTHRRREALISPSKMISLVESCHSSSHVELSQSWLYNDLKKRIQSHSVLSLYPCRACAGRAVYINGGGLCSGCHRQPIRDPSQMSETPAKALRDSREDLFGRSDFAREECRSCPFRYFCGGVCEFVDVRVGDPTLSRRLFQLHCATRKHMLLKFFEDATVESQAIAKRAYMLESGNGRLDLVPVEDLK